MTLMRILSALAASAFAVPAAAQTVLPSSAAPEAWVRYAEAAVAAVTEWLQDSGEAATRLRAYLDAMRPASDQPTPPLTLRIRIAQDGTVSRVDFAPFAHAEADAALRAAILGRRLAEPPPGMLQPLVLSVQLSPRPADPAKTGRAVCHDGRTPGALGGNIHCGGAGSD